MRWRIVRAIAWKEWHAAMDQPLGFVVMAAFLLVAGFFFGKNLFLAGLADMRPWLEIAPLLLSFFAPAATMRLVAEERREGTFELLATQPITDAEIVAGKFLGALGQLSLWLAATLIYPLSLFAFSSPDLGAIASGYLALWLLAALAAAAGLFASSLARHGVIAYVLGFALLFFAWILERAAATLPPAWQDALAWINPIAHYRAMLRGVIGLEDIMAFAAWAGVLLAAAWLRLVGRRWA